MALYSMSIFNTLKLIGIIITYKYTLQHTQHSVMKYIKIVFLDEKIQVEYKFNTIMVIIYIQAHIICAEHLINTNKYCYQRTPFVASKVTIFGCPSTCGFTRLFGNIVAFPIHVFG